MKRGLACCRHVVKHAALLQAQRRDDRKDALVESAPARTIGSEAAFSPQDALTEYSFRGVVRGFDPSMETPFVSTAEGTSLERGSASELIYRALNKAK